MDKKPFNLSSSIGINALDEVSQAQARIPSKKAMLLPHSSSNTNMARVSEH